MSKKDRLIRRLLQTPKDFTFDDAEALLSYPYQIRGLIEHLEQEDLL